MEEEIPLTGGNSSNGVVQVGDTVRKPWTENSSGVLAYMRVIRERGVEVPEPLGRDEEGRMMIGFIPGRLALNTPPLSKSDLRRVGALVRGIHDASVGLDAETLGLGPALIPVDDADLVCHGDLTPWNLVIGKRWVFIDWDGSAASTRVWDLAYSAQAFTLNDPRADPHASGQRLRAFVDGYGADSDLRSALTEALSRRAWAMHDLLEGSHLSGRDPWGWMYVHGHGNHWRSVARWVDEHEQVWQTALIGE